MTNIYTINEIKEKLTLIFKSEPVYKAVLFGSYAKGKATEKSDIDIMVDSRGKLLNMNFYGVLYEISESLGKKIDLFEITEIKKNSQLFNEINNKGVVLYERKG